MDRFRNILVVVDDPASGSNALARGAQLALSSGARLTAIHAITGVRASGLRLPAGISLDDLEESEQSHRMAELESLLSNTPFLKPKCTAKVVLGTPFIEIIREVVERRHDLVIKDAPARGAFKNSLFSSLDMHLMRKCPVPVWMVRENAGRKYRRIVAAIHPDAPDTEHESLNRGVLDLGAALARLDHAELHVMHAWELYGDAMLSRARHRISSGQVLEILKYNHDRATEMLDRIVSSHPSEEVRKAQRHLLRGPPAVALLQLTRRLRADVVVMGTVARTGVAGLIIGNTAETVLNQVNCSVLAIKPEGFVSPLRFGEIVYHGEPATRSDARFSY